MCSGCASPIGEWVRWGLRAAQGNPSFTVDPECLHWASPTESEAFQVFSYIIAVVNVTVLVISTES